MNSGGAHCIKYGVTIVLIGWPFMDAGSFDLLGLICGSEGQLGVVTKAWLRILPKPEGARPERRKALAWIIT